MAGGMQDWPGFGNFVDMAASQAQQNSPITQIAAQQRMENVPGIQQARMALPGQQLAQSELVGGTPNVFTTPAYMSNQAKPAEQLTQQGTRGMQFNTIGGGANRFNPMGRPFQGNMPTQPQGLLNNPMLQESMKRRKNNG